MRVYVYEFVLRSHIHALLNRDFFLLTRVRGRYGKIVAPKKWATFPGRDGRVHQSAQPITSSFHWAVRMVPGLPGRTSWRVETGGLAGANHLLLISRVNNFRFTYLTLYSHPGEGYESATDTRIMSTTQSFCDGMVHAEGHTTSREGRIKTGWGSWCGEPGSLASIRLRRGAPRRTMGCPVYSLECMRVVCLYMHV